MKYRVIALATLLAATLTANAETLNDGVFTKEQAERGKATYETHCKACHPVEDYKMRLSGWHNAPLVEFYEIIAGSMPQTTPGSLTDEEYADALAHIFSLLGYPTGDKELSYIDGSMEEIMIVTK